VRFDALSLVLHDAATNTMRLHVLETTVPVESPLEIVLNPDDDPAGLVWQTQQPLITSDIVELSRWPRLLERVRPYGVQSYCWLPLTTARRRLGALVFTSRQPSAHDAADLDFLHQVANQVAVAVENALAFQEIEALKDKLAKEKAYLEEEVRTEHEFGDIVGESPALRAVLKAVETVLACVGGLIPLALSGGPLWEPMCYVQIVGMLVATLVTLVIVPVLYVIFVEDLRLVRWEMEPNAPQQHQPGTTEAKPPATTAPSESAVAAGERSRRLT
jgi:formate hydrogenlyase transcriptional activator